MTGIETARRACKKQNAAFQFRSRAAHIRAFILPPTEPQMLFCFFIISGVIY
jgi:hypothetical protein